MADVYSLSIRADTTEVTRAKQALAGLSSGAMKAESTTKNLARSASRTSGAFRLQRGAAQQLGFQLQDIAVQAQGGVSAFQILGQQGSQLAGVFGPGGALFGAVIAIGAAIGGTLFRSTETASEGTETLIERTQRLVEVLGEATASQREFINTEFQQRINQQEQAVKAAEESIVDITKRLESFRRAAGENVPDAVFEANSAVMALKQGLEDARLTIDNATASTEAITKEQTEFWKEVEKSGEEAEDAEEKLRSFVDAIVLQGETVGLSAKQTALYEAARLGANEADIAAIENAFQLIEAERVKEEALKKAEEREKRTQKALMESTKIGVQDDPILQRIEAQRRAQEMLAEESAVWAQKIANNQQTIQEQSIATVGASIGAMQSFFEQGTAEFIAFGLLQKGLMAGQAVMAANLAATLALTAQVPGDPTGPARAIAQAETIRTLGYINAGLILATGIGEAVSGARQMGGSVTGGRSYMVGESGPEIVTMGGSGVVTPSSVMDQGKNQGGDWVVNINNAPPGTRTESRTDDSGNRFTEVFIADMSNGGPMSRTMQGTFGLRRQGR